MRLIRVCIRCEGVLVALDDGALLDKGVPDDPFCEVVDLFADKVEASNLLDDGTGCPLALLVEGLDIDDVGGLSRVCWVLRLG